jgi:hypothetical protein
MRRVAVFEAGPIPVEDYWSGAKRSLPDMIWSFLEYGADDLRTLDPSEPTEVAPERAVRRNPRDVTSG